MTGEEQSHPYLGATLTEDNQNVLFSTDFYNHSQNIHISTRQQPPRRCVGLVFLPVVILTSRAHVRLTRTDCLPLTNANIAHVVSCATKRRQSSVDYGCL